MARERDVELVDDEREEDDDELADLAEENGGSGAVGFLTGLLLGAFIGAGIALVLAPERGEVTRKKIRERLHDFGEDARERIDDVREEAGRELRLQRRRLRRRLTGRH